MSSDTEKTDLLHRTQMPEPLRVLLKEIPRDQWEAHPNFSELVQFWLERHMMFRKLLGMLDTDAKRMLDREMDPVVYGRRLAQFGGMLVNQLHGHHQIEDQHYFPALRALDPRVERGFDILDSDHHALDGIIDRFTASANDVLRASGDPAVTHEATGALDKELVGFNQMLDRHLNDEEELIVPVILKNRFEGLQ